VDTEHDSLTLYTIGHSTHPIERFLSLLIEHEIVALADVRSYPGSKRWPQFKQSELQNSLSEKSIAYHWFPALGGRRQTSKELSPHSAWKTSAFRSYADYADTAEFDAGLEELVSLASRQRTAYMCAEGLWWRCHRRIISDHLVVRGMSVLHIMPDGKLVKHELAAFASVRGGRIVYDGVAEAESTESS
jgi:uncharacterized protein (DUF488 family)